LIAAPRGWQFGSEIIESTGDIRLDGCPKLECGRREIAMSRKTLGIIVAVVGVALIVISALADVIGVGDGDGFGLLQIAGVVVGALGAVFGGLAAFREPTS
jgi:hypothetical protein